MSDLTRSACGFAAFQCNPDTCQERCFTAEYIELKATYAPQPAKFGPVALSIIFAILVAALVGSVAVGPARVEAQFQSDMRR